ncbi:4-amino-4-deoxychorismate lyase [Mycolicibacterium madagascariense]|uniref:4-amino-4-deoxychorismate lyase n=1 Tax=Mycolicibacterium madagascariense TaxID=212765 RepID=A0A7I7XMD7_9MYCO|nr:aminodeoxychorismate lyase [Mycolicibacterium madagascariense]MCV7013092.1 aminodeoxychorismate lyase [Mycolicibacterium madagascariense]BBZ30399.1 4-amino-4-deoxychorismate lyase [Mycolicibacterium madagascariense]
MTTRSPLVVTLDGKVAAPGEPFVAIDDPMVARGAGVFETLLLRAGVPCLLAAHLERLAGSSAIVGLPPPDAARWRAAVAVACDRWPDADDAVMRLVSGRATGFVMVSELPARVVQARGHGVSAVTVDRGLPAAPGAGWSIAGAKSLSYGIYAAALRHAERLGAGDAVLVSSDGFVLEGPRSSVVVLDRDGVLLTPPTTLPILPGITARALFDVARGRGVSCVERSLRIADLEAAHGVWLVSSVTLAARVHTLDARPLDTTPPMIDVPALIDEAMAARP